MDMILLVSWAVLVSPFHSVMLLFFLFLGRDEEEEGKFYCRVASVWHGLHLQLGICLFWIATKIIIEMRSFGFYFITCFYHYLIALHEASKHYSSTRFLSSHSFITVFLLKFWQLIAKRKNLNYSVGNKCSICWSNFWNRPVVCYDHTHCEAHNLLMVGYLCDSLFITVYTLSCVYWNEKLQSPVYIPVLIISCLRGSIFLCHC